MNSTQQQFIRMLLFISITTIFGVVINNMCIEAMSDNSLFKNLSKLKTNLEYLSNKLKNSTTQHKGTGASSNAKKIINESNSKEQTNGKLIIDSTNELSETIPTTTDYLVFDLSRKVNNTEEIGKICTFINQAQNLDALSINLSFNNLRDEQCNKIMQNIKTNKLENLELDLRGNNIENNEFLDTIQKFKKLKYLYLSLPFNNINTQGIEKIGNYLKNLSTLEHLHLDLYGINIGKGAYDNNIGYIFKNLNMLINLKSIALGLASNNINDDDVKDVFDGINNMSHLEKLKLDLGNNKEISNNVISYFKKSLQTLKNLETVTINLRECNLDTDQPIKIDTINNLSSVRILVDDLTIINSLIDLVYFFESNIHDKNDIHTMTLDFSSDQSIKELNNKMTKYITEKLQNLNNLKRLVINLKNKKINQSTLEILTKGISKIHSIRQVTFNLDFYEKYINTESFLNCFKCFNEKNILLNLDLKFYKIQHTDIENFSKILSPLHFITNLQSLNLDLKFYAIGSNGIKLFLNHIVPNLKFNYKKIKKLNLDFSRCNLSAPVANVILTVLKEAKLENVFINLTHNNINVNKIKFYKFPKTWNITVESQKSPISDSIKPKDIQKMITDKFSSNSNNNRKKAKPFFEELKQFTAQKNIDLNEKIKDKLKDLYKKDEVSSQDIKKQKRIPQKEEEINMTLNTENVIPSNIQSDEESGLEKLKSKLKKLESGESGPQKDKLKDKLKDKEIQKNEISLNIKKEYFKQHLYGTMFKDSINKKAGSPYTDVNSTVGTPKPLTNSDKALKSDEKSKSELKELESELESGESGPQKDKLKDKEIQKNVILLNIEDERFKQSLLKTMLANSIKKKTGRTYSDKALKSELELESKLEKLESGESEPQVEPQQDSTSQTKEISAPQTISTTDVKKKGKKLKIPLNFNKNSENNDKKQINPFDDNDDSKFSLDEEEGDNESFEEFLQKMEELKIKNQNNQIQNNSNKLLVKNNTTTKNTSLNEMLQKKKQQLTRVETEEKNSIIPKSVDINKQNNVQLNAAFIELQNNVAFFAKQKQKQEEEEDDDDDDDEQNIHLQNQGTIPKITSSPAKSSTSSGMSSSQESSLQNQNQSLNSQEIPENKNYFSQASQSDINKESLNPLQNETQSQIQGQNKLIEDEQKNLYSKYGFLLKKFVFSGVQDNSLLIFLNDKFKTDINTHKNDLNMLKSSIHEKLENYVDQNNQKKNALHITVLEKVKNNLYLGEDGILTFKESETDPEKKFKKN
jgi:hypothetical protein